MAIIALISIGMLLWCLSVISDNGINVLLVKPKRSSSQQPYVSSTNSDVVSTLGTTAVQETTQSRSGGRILPVFTKESFLRIPNDGWCEGLSRNNSAPSVLLLVLSAVGEFNIRQIIRHSINRTRYPLMRIYFILGLPNASKVSLKIPIGQEALMLRDIIQGNFSDTYDNLPLKSLALLSWATLFCKNVHFVLKVDSDVVILFHQLYSFTSVEYVSLGRTITNGNRIYGHVWRGAPVIRDPSHKWYVPPYQYRNNVFPDYCAGPAYLMTGDVPQRIVGAAIGAPFVRIEDALFTGILAEKTKTKRVGNSRFSFSRLQKISCQQKPITAHIRDRSEWMQLFLHYQHQMNACP